MVLYDTRNTLPLVCECPTHHSTTGIVPILSAPPAPPCGAVTRLVGWRLVTMPGLYKWAVIFPATIPLPFSGVTEHFFIFYIYYYCIETEKIKGYIQSAPYIQISMHLRL